MWSGGAPRRSALCSSTSSCSRTRCWPTNSASRLGRTRRLGVALLRRRRTRETSRRLGHRVAAQQPDRLLEQHRHRRRRRRRRSRRRPRPPGRPAPASSRARPAPARTCSAQPRRRATPRPAGDVAADRADPVAQLQDQPLGALLADARAPGSASPTSPVAIARRTASGRVHREHRLGQPRARPRWRSAAARTAAARRRRRSRTGSASPRARPGWWPAGPRRRPAAPASVPGAHVHRQARRRRPRPRRRPAPTAATRPRTLAIIAVLPPARRGGRRGGRGRLLRRCRRARCGRSPAPARRRRRPAGAARPAAAAG